MVYNVRAWSTGLETKKRLLNRCSKQTSQFWKSLFVFEVIMVKYKHTIRFWKRTKKLGLDNCWEWLACKDRKGYGQIRTGKRTIGAHRLSWIIHNGKIPEGMLVCHSCDNPGCVNPDHLFLGTNKDNIQDASKKGRMTGPRGEAAHTSKLTEKQVLAIRHEYASMDIKSQSKLADKYHVSGATISYIINGHRWKHI